MAFELLPITRLCVPMAASFQFVPPPELPARIARLSGYQTKPVPIVLSNPAVVIVSPEFKRCIELRDTCVVLSVQILLPELCSCTQLVLSAS